MGECAGAIQGLAIALAMSESEHSVSEGTGEPYEKQSQEAPKIMARYVPVLRHRAATLQSITDYTPPDYTTSNTTRLRSPLTPYTSNLRNPLKGVIAINPATSHTVMPPLISVTKRLLDPSVSDIQWYATARYALTSTSSWVRRTEFPHIKTAAVKFHTSTT